MLYYFHIQNTGKTTKEEEAHAGNMLNEHDLDGDIFVDPVQFHDLLITLVLKLVEEMIDKIVLNRLYILFI